MTVSLDPGTANPHLILSADQKSVTRGRRAQDLPDNPERFDTMICVLGYEKFTSGRHCWEVEVDVEDEVESWAVGAARESVKRKGKLTLCPEEGIWAVGKSLNATRQDMLSPGQLSAFTSPLQTPLPLTNESRKIRVFLNYEGMCVEFFDAYTDTLIFTFSSASFSGEKICPFFRVGGKEVILKC